MKLSKRIRRRRERYKRISARFQDLHRQLLEDFFAPRSLMTYLKEKGRVKDVQSRQDPPE